MSEARCSEEEFIALFKTHGPTGTAKILGGSERRVYARRRQIERARGISIQGPRTEPQAVQVREIRASQRLRKTIRNGVVLIGSDAHYWPGPPSTAHRAMVHLCRELKPSMVIMNGDVLDGAKISRHARIGWDDRPEVIDEIEVCKERLDEIRNAAPKKCQFVWPLGNHDARFETLLANQAPQYAEVHGMALQDHFPWWEPCWSLWINNDIVVKHRFKGGIHAAHNNTLWAGKSIFTGHLHSLKVTPFSDFNGTRFGGDSGTMMDPYDDQTADYTEDNPVNWRSGFLVLTFRDSQLLWPEVVHVIDDGKVDFRGEIVGV